MVVNVSDDGSRLVPGPPTVRARQPYFGGLAANYAVFPDGRVLMVRQESQPNVADRLIVVQDWLSELTRRLAGR